MATFTKRVGASADDGGKIVPGSWHYTDWGIFLGKFSTDSSQVGIRFLNVTIPQGSTINSATIKIIADITDTDSATSIKIYGIAEDNTADFSTDPTGRTKTTANTTWNLSATTLDVEYTSPDIASAVQEIIDRGSWASGNAMGFLLPDNASSNSNALTYYSYDENTTKAAFLTIDYTESATTTSTSTSTTSTSTSTTSTSTTNTSTSTTSTSTSMTSTSTSTTSTSSSTTTLPAALEIYGVKVLKENVTENTTDPEDFFLNSRYPLLKVHKNGAFLARYVPNSGVTVTIQYNELKYRPIVLVYCQRVTHAPSIDTTYHFLEWSYWGASQEGYQTVKIYNNRFVFNYRDTDAGVDNSIWDLYGYYYIFDQEVTE